MRKTIVMLAVVVGLAGLQMNAEARGGNGGGGSGGAVGTVSQGGGQGMRTAGDTNRYQHRERVQVRDGSGTGTGTMTRNRLQLHDPASHTPAPVETTMETAE
ncbi:MAG: hypothetical protein P1P84_07550 [Deferrisomatales bacterium]|nr:hypothetical protein [Deferrisomatales bacterium]